jgi:two-component system, OmpR family, sensor histidine kinase SenX3
MRRRKTAIFFLVFGISLIVLAVALQVGWILLNVREVALMVLGIIFFALIITGLVLNTIFLVREIKRSEQHDAFLNSVTHELKTPIASIKLYLETLKTRKVTPEKQMEFYDVMLADSNRLLNTVEQVLQASSTKERKRQFSASEIDIGELINESVAIIRTGRNLDEGAIRFSEPAEPIKIMGDAADLQTAFINLLDNALKYSSDDPKISIRTKKTAMNKRVDIFVKDQGIGIPSADLKRIFKRFYRVAKPSGNEAKGTGLGLFIVKSIVERHGGKVSAQSRGEGLGTTFLVQLPVSTIVNRKS